MDGAGYLSIGEVLSLLKPEFADLTISKIRFLESQGLLDPERTPSGYRKFYETDIDRLRWILRQQHENYLPLKVIKGKLGTEPDADDDEGAPAPPAADLGPEGGVVSDLFGAFAGGVKPSPAALGSDSSALTIDPGPASQPSRFSPASPGSAARAGARRGPRTPTPEPAAVVLPRPPEMRPLRRSPGMNPARQPSDPRPSPDSDTNLSWAKPGLGSQRQAPGTSRPAGTTRDYTAEPVEPRSTLSLTLDELAAKTGNTRAELIELEQFGLLIGKSVDGVVYYDAEALTLAHLAAGFLRYGVGARHLRMYRTSAEREATFFEQVVMPMLKQRNPQARKQAIDALQELSALGEGLRASLLRQALRGHTGP